MKNLNDIILKAIGAGSSDIHISTKRPASCRVYGKLFTMDTEILENSDLERMVKPFLAIKGVADKMETLGEADFAYSFDDTTRFRVNMFKQKGEYAVVMRLLPTKMPDPEVLGLPEAVQNFVHLKRGLVLVTGETGSGKSTTLASLINRINQTQQKHIITIEDPVEFVHQHKMSLVNQREIGIDTMSFANALRASLREDPDIILVGEMRDLETIETALTAAETGHLVFSTLHTNSAPSTIDRIVDVFPTNQQDQVRVQLANVLEGIVCQQLLPVREGIGRVAAFEVMVANPAIRNLIREGKSFQLTSQIQTGRRQGMQTMDDCLFKLFEQKKIFAEDAVRFALDPANMTRLCNL
jgi:twitching motility protein PilT